MRKKLLIAMLLLSLFVAGAQAEVSQAKKIICKNPKVTKKKVTWDCVYFGNYYQKKETKKEKIKWRVLFVKKNQALLVSDKILDYGAQCGYQDYWKGYTLTFEELTKQGNYWKYGLLRKWLNKSFYKTAFSAKERKKLLSIKSNAATRDPDNKPLEKAVYVKDKVTLLSFGNLEKASYGLKNPRSRLAYMTKYAQMRRQQTESLYEAEKVEKESLKQAAFYWCCDICMEGTGGVSYDGSLASLGTDDDYPNGIRPVICIKLDPSLVKKAKSVTVKLK